MSDFLASLLAAASGEGAPSLRPRAVSRFEARPLAAPEPPLEVLAEEPSAEPALPPARGVPPQDLLPATIAPAAPAPRPVLIPQHQPVPQAPGVAGPPSAPPERQLIQQELSSASTLQSPEPGSVLPPSHQLAPARGVTAAPLAPPEASAKAPLTPSPDQPLPAESGRLRPSHSQPLDSWTPRPNAAIRPAVELGAVAPEAAGAPALAALLRPAAAPPGTPPRIAPPERAAVTPPTAISGAEEGSDADSPRPPAADSGKVRAHPALTAPPGTEGRSTDTSPAPASPATIRAADAVNVLAVPPQPVMAPPEPIIRVTIGRVEVRAAPPSPPARPAAPAGPRLSLDAYLRSRRGGGR